MNQCHNEIAFHISWVYQKDNNNKTSSVWDEVKNIGGAEN